MPPSEIKKNAREALRGKWGIAISILLIYWAFSFLIAILESMFKNFSPAIYTIISFAYYLISIPLHFGLVISFMKLKRNTAVSAFDFLKDGLSHFTKSWGIALYTTLKLLLPFICLILVFILLFTLFAFNLKMTNSSTVTILLTVCSVILYIATLIYMVSRAFLYVLAMNIAYDHPELSSKACVLKSEALMKGNRGNYFMLELSFIGWYILAILSLGIGILWLLPYMQVASICFYEKVANLEPKK